MRLQWCVGAFLAGLVLLSCGGGRPGGGVWEKDPRPLVYVSILPQLGLARRLAGDAARVEALVAPGENPHNFQPTVRQVSGLSGARVWLTLGTPFEATLQERIRSATPGLRVVNTADGVEMLRYGDTVVELGEEDGGHEHGHEGHAHGHGLAAVDEHLWLSPRRMRVVVANMAAALGEACPEAAGEIRRRAVELDAEWQALDLELAEVLAPLRGTTILAYHGAFGYLVRDYGLRQAAVEFGGKEPSPARIERLTRLMRQHGIRVVFVQAQYPVDSARILAEGTGAVVVPLDDLPEDLIGGLRGLAQALRDGGMPARPRHE